MAIVNKIWILGGWFYLSLTAAIILFFISPKKIKAYISRGIIIFAAIVSLYLSYKEIAKDTGQIRAFFRPIDEKIEMTTAGQASFATHLRKILPADATGCIYWSWDLPTLYLQKELYPYIFAVIQRATFSDCRFVISQFNRLVDPRLRLTDSYQGNYLYEVID
ncbi:hypothetical protein HYU92_02070 [Candidatus Curtissbacteria bacterium]|nr:hypothetical protein [Candidatus Curtissbacteria bacterium]